MQHKDMKNHLENFAPFLFFFTPSTFEDFGKVHFRGFLKGICLRELDPTRKVGRIRVCVEALLPFLLTFVLLVEVKDTGLQSRFSKGVLESQLFRRVRTLLVGLDDL